jgi:hypothetical protein
MEELDSKILELALKSGATHHMPYQAGFSMSHPTVEKFYSAVVEQTYENILKYLSWTLQDCIDDRAITSDIMFKVMSGFEYNYGEHLYGKK